MQQQQDTKVYFKDGGQYQSFRPKYPSKFIQKIRGLRGGRNYLDLATGTGQLLFQFYHLFGGLSLGTDISESMLKAAQKQAEDLASSLKAGQEIKFLQGDCQRIDELVSRISADKKFDLVTIGEAFHWFDMETLLEKIKTQILSQDGTLAILSYFIEDIELSTNNKALQDKVSRGYLEFYNTVKVYSKFDQDVLYSGYAGINFEKFFKITKETETEKAPSRVEDVIGHLNTWSMYNTYLEKHSQEKGFIDPLKKLSQIIEETIEAGTASNELTNKDYPVSLVIPYQLIITHQ